MSIADKKMAVYREQACGRRLHWKEIHSHPDLTGNFTVDTTESCFSLPYYLTYREESGRQKKRCWGEIKILQSDFSASDRSNFWECCSYVEVSHIIWALQFANSLPRAALC